MVILMMILMTILMTITMIIMTITIIIMRTMSRRLGGASAREAKDGHSAERHEDREEARGNLLINQ